MNKVGPEGRSFERVEVDDLRRLRDIAQQNRALFLGRKRDWGRLNADWRICLALGPGAALHYVNGTTDVKDFDLYTFFRAPLSGVGVPSGRRPTIRAIRNSAVG